MYNSIHNALSFKSEIKAEHVPSTESNPKLAMPKSGQCQTTTTSELPTTEACEVLAGPNPKLQVSKVSSEYLVPKL